jgi:hypothetical protein
MDPPYISKRTSPVLSPSEVITPAKSKSRGLLGDLAGWPSYSDMRTQAPGSQDSGGLHRPASLTRCVDPSLPLCMAIWILISSGCNSETPFGNSHASGAFQKSSQLPTPQRYASHQPGAFWGIFPVSQRFGLLIFLLVSSWHMANRRTFQPRKYGILYP